MAAAETARATAAAFPGVVARYARRSRAADLIRAE